MVTGLMDTVRSNGSHCCLFRCNIDARQPSEEMMKKKKKNILLCLILFTPFVIRFRRINIRSMLHTAEFDCYGAVSLAVL